MNKFLKTAINKCQRFSNTKEFCGYLTPQEIVAIIDAGAKPTETNEHIYLKAQEKVKKGISNPTWFYFYPSKLKMKNETSNK